MVEFETGVIIGSDESLKGDTFGGVVVAAVKADDAIREKLTAMGVMDSKRLTDKKILGMAQEIKKVSSFKVRSVFPEEYNQRKITEWLNKLHQECYDSLKPGKHVVDKYPGCKVGEIVEEKAEDKYVEVAAASILAREAALKQLDSLSVKAGFRLPKGSTHVKLALVELKKRGLDFNKFVKLDFRNVKEFL
jgi:ribonuclease HIII